MRMHAIFLDAAARMLGTEKCCAFLYIPLFLVFIAAFGLILIIEFKSILAGGALHFNHE